MRLVLSVSVLLLAAAAHAAVHPNKYVNVARRLNAVAVANRQASSDGGYTLDPCSSKADCKPPRFCAFTKCIIGEADETTCKSCAECPGYKDKKEVCAIDPDAGISCVSASGASILSLELTAGCENAPAKGPAPTEPSFPQGPMPSVTTPPDSLPVPKPTPEQPAGVPTNTEAPVTTEVQPSTAPQSTESTVDDDSDDDDESTEDSDSDSSDNDETETETEDDDDDPAEAPEETDGEEESEVEPSPTPICIAVEHLAHLPSHELVFNSHMRARVLCDTKDSCATPGHIVVFRGRPMMMRSYCDVAHGGCTERRKLVNSPRFKRKVVVPSNTDELHFTALAARYESRLEEHALKLAVRVGF